MEKLNWLIMVVNNRESNRDDYDLKEFCVIDEVL